jgi:GT2 family glycosyltransferase
VVTCSRSRKCANGVSCMGNGMKIGVVTVTYNSSQVIDAFMECLLRQTYSDFVLYSVDNASSDDTLKRLSNYQDCRVVIVRNTANVGVAEGNNIGIRAALKAGCGSALLINNDTVFDSDLLSKLQDALHEYECEMVAPKILFFDDPSKIWSAGGYFSRMRGAARHFGFEQKDDGRFDQARAVSYNATCCMLIKKEVFDRIGLMDANYFVYFDDTDFCLRAHRAGLRLFYVPAARLLHKAGSLTGGASAFSFRYSTRNHVYYLLKNFPWWYSLFYLPMYEIHIFVRYLLLWRRPESFWVAQKAFWEGISLSISGTRRSPKSLKPMQGR